MTLTRFPVLILTLVLCAGISRVHAAGLQGRVVDPGWPARCRRYRAR